MTAKRDNDQARRFEEAAREAGADETGEAFERAFAHIVPAKRHPPVKPKPAKKPRNV